MRNSIYNLSFFFTLAWCSAHAGTFQVSPIRVELGAAVNTAALTVRNESASEEVIVQTRPMRWKQLDGKDDYTATTDLIASPPVFTLKPGGQQIVRIGLRKPIANEMEQTYRVYLTEVAPPPRPGFQGLQVVLNLGVPVFIAPKGEVKLNPDWKAHLTSDEKLQLQLHNNGNTHMRVLEMIASDKTNNTPLAALAEPRYILAGQAYRWSLPMTHKPEGKIVLAYKTYGAESEIELPLSPP